MVKLNLHADGKDYHLRVLKENYETLKKKIKANMTLNDSSKAFQLKSAKTAYNKAKVDANRNLY